MPCLSALRAARILARSSSRATRTGGFRVRILLIAKLLRWRTIGEVTDFDIPLSDKEHTRRAIIRSLNMGDLTRAEAAEKLDISLRRLRSLCDRFKAHGNAGLIDRRRLTRGNHRIPSEIRTAVIDLVRTKYAGRSCAAICRKLRQHHNMRIHAQTLRTWLRAENLIACRKSRLTREVNSQPAAVPATPTRNLRFTSRRKLLRRPRPAHQGPSTALMFALRKVQQATNELVIQAELEFAAHKLIAAVDLASEALRNLPGLMLHEAKARRFDS